MPDRSRGRGLTASIARLAALPAALLLAAALVPACGGKTPEEAVRNVNTTRADSLEGWPADVARVRIRSSADSTLQPALFWAPERREAPAPLLVALHTWSGDWRQPDSRPYLEECRRRGWLFLHPDFRGPNLRPAAGGSELATADILDAVEWACARGPVDRRRIYLVGASGGGHMTLLTAARHPELWAAVSAWVPITDLTAWHEECAARGLGYADNLEQVCGGPPGAAPEVDRQYRERSSLPILGALAGVPVDLNAGIHDGHSGSVPVSHTLRAFGALAAANRRPAAALSPEQLARFVEEERVPAELALEREDDPLYGDKPVLFRRTAGPARVTIFAGGHEVIPAAALDWLSRHHRP